jgi:fructosamine-3-kinase
MSGQKKGNSYEELIRTLVPGTVSSRPVFGGDINSAFQIEDTGGKKYFLKLNDAVRSPGMFEKEANGLSELKKGSSLYVPEVIRHGISGNYQYLLMEWIEKGPQSVNFWKSFGSGLADMHKVPQPFFGFTENNYIGSLVQVNSPAERWSVFYAQSRILPAVKQLFERRDFSKSDLSAAENFCNRINEIFPGEPPALLHGDLWSGNYMIAANGHAAIFDPAVYYGHREMDLGMTRLFGGFDLDFYRSYQAFYPLEKGWQDRLRYTQLYPLLVHSLLFGGHYIQSVKNVLRQF